jgi:hypothetical protein
MIWYSNIFNYILFIALYAFSRVSCPLPLCPLTLWAYYSIIYFFPLSSLSVTNCFYYSIIYLFSVLWVPCQLQIIYHFGDWPVRDLSCALSCFCLVSAWAPCHWFLVAGSYGGCVHWTPPFLVDLVYHIFLTRLSNRSSCSTVTISKLNQTIKQHS